MRAVSFGCDPEIFVQNELGDICSAIGKFGGTKEKPKPIKILGEGFAVQEDNVLVEFNIPPAKNGEEFVKSVQATVDVLARRAARKGLSFAKGSAYSLKPDYLQDPAALVFGCDPDFNAYTGQANPSPSSPDKNLRSAGGHIAVGVQNWGNLPDAHQHAYAKAIITNLDFLLGVPSILLDEGELRKQLYGKAGAFRIKPFGVEYRTLSNFWIFRPELAKKMIGVLTNKDLGNHRFGPQSFAWNQVAINTNNKEYARWAVDNFTELAWVKEFI